jgi:hypothetical protein
MSIDGYRIDRWEEPFFIFTGSQNMQIHQNLAIDILGDHTPFSYCGNEKLK